MSWNLEQAANDLERYVLRGELPAIDACKVLIDNARTERTCKNVYDEMKMGACDNGFECSECGEKVEDCEGYHVKGTWNYCPGCRAKVVD